MKAENRKLYKKAIEKWGDELQIVVAVEELSELQKELCKNLRGEQNFTQIAEEIADVEIMLEQLRVIYSIEEEISEIKDTKLDRLSRRVERCE